MPPHRSHRLIGAACILVLAALSCIWVGRHYRQQNLNRALIAAIKKSDASKVDDLLAAGADANTRDTPAKQRSFRDIIHDLFRPPIDVSDTALFDAAYNKAPHIVKALIASGADVNANTKDGFTPLMVAADNGDIESVNALIKAHADVDARDNEGATALIVIADTYAFDNSACTRALISAGADVNAKNNYGESALARAELGEIIDILKAAGGKE